MCVCLVTQYLTLCNPLDCSLPGFSDHGIFQALTGVGCHFLLQSIFLKESNPSVLCLLPWQVGSSPAESSRKPTHI